MCSCDIEGSLTSPSALEQAATHSQQAGQQSAQAAQSAEAASTNAFDACMAGKGYTIGP